MAWLPVASAGEAAGSQPAPIVYTELPKEGSGDHSVILFVVCIFFYLLLLEFTYAVFG